MSAPTRKDDVRWARSLFPRLRRHVVRWAYADTDWYGLHLPGDHSDTVVVNLGNCVQPDGKFDWTFARGVLLHELIHVEQNTLAMRCDHGAYFRARREELMELTGVYIPPGTPS